VQHNAVEGENSFAKVARTSGNVRAVRISSDVMPVSFVQRGLISHRFGLTK
jgi:hypothetical protein